MKAVLICPDKRREAGFLARAQPLVLVPFLGKPLLDHALGALANEGVQEVRLIVSDRPDEVRRFVNGGQPWGIRVDVESVPGEPDPKSFTADVVKVLDHVPGRPEWKLFDGYRSWFAALGRALPELAARHVGGRERSPGVWCGLKARIAPDADITGPCWIGDQAWIRSGAQIGPNAFVESGAMIDTGAIVADSYIGAFTYVGQLTEVRKSFVVGDGLLNWENGSSVVVVDEFLLGPLKGRVARRGGGSVLGRVVALIALLTTWPIVALAWMRNLGGGRPLFEIRQAVIAPRPDHAINAPPRVYRRLNGFSGVWSRWPDLLRIVAGEFAWIGNRPLAPDEAALLENEFEQLWLDAPTGLFSLADAEGCADPLSDEGRAHASFFAAAGDRRVRRRILRAFVRRVLSL
jgi:hypothetical protein